MASKTCYLKFRALPSRNVCASDVSLMVYVVALTFFRPLKPFRLTFLRMRVSRE